MIYVFEGGSIVYDGSTISDEQKTKAVAVEQLPEKPEIPAGKMAIIRANKAEERVWWELVDKPKDPLEVEVEQLKQVVADLTELILFGGIE
jgi:hypothetical protein